MGKTVFFTLVAAFQGAWMVFDGVHVQLYGKFFGPDKPGPWADLVSVVGVDPFSLGPIFVIFGLLWTAVAATAWLKSKWFMVFRIVVSAATLWYVPIGTVLSLAVVVVSILGKRTSSPSRKDRK